MKIFLCLFLFYGVVKSNSQKCSCGSSGPEDKNLADCAESFANEQGIIGLVKRKSKEICLSYKYKVKNGLPICKFPKNAIATNIDCDTESDGSKKCIIKDPNHSDLNKCYPAQQFCVHNVQCKVRETIQFHCTGMDLPKSSSGECLDEVRLKNDQIGVISLCGTADKNCKNFESIIGSLQISFTSSQLCHGCGYDFTVRCVPSPDIFSAGGVKKREEDRRSNIFGERYRRASARTKFEVPVGAKVYYRNNVVTVKKEYRTLIRKRTPTLLVYDEIFGVVICRGTAHRHFVGYGVMYLQNTHIYYYQQGIPNQFKPTSKERQYMSEALTTLRRTTDKAVKTSITGTFSAGVPGIPPFLSGPRKHPKYQAKRGSSFSVGTCRGLPGRPGPEFEKRVRAKALEQLRTSKNLFVKSVAQLVLKTFKQQTIPGTPGMKGAP